MKEKFTVTGMTCSACQAHVDKAVRKLPGVGEVNVNLLGGSMSVEHDETVTAQAIVEAVTKAGYGASLATANVAPKTDVHRADPMEGELKNMKGRFIASICFMLPLFYLSMGHMMGLPIPHFFHGLENAFLLAFTQFLLTIPILVINQKYYRVGYSTPVS